MGKVKSLRDCLLENAVVNFDKIFFENGGEVKKHICLPPMLFEDIQDKSNEMCWIIPLKSWRGCLSNRDALNWVNIDLTMWTTTLDDLLQIAKSNFPVKRLSFRTEDLTDAMMEVIEKFSSTIEVLEIDYRCAFQDVEVSHEYLDQTLLKFPKLKVLSVRLDVVPAQFFQRFDLSSCSESLKKLCLLGFLHSSDEKKGEEQLIMNFIDSLEVLKNLESLTIKDKDICRKIKSIVHLKNLRTLDLGSMPSNIPPGLRLVYIFPKLENLTIPQDNLIEELNSLRGKKLNYVGSHEEVDVPEHLKQVAKNFGLGADLKSYVTFLDYCCFHDYIDKTFGFVEMLSDMSYKTQDKSILFKDCDIRKVEKIILDHLMWGLFDVQYCVNAITDFKDIWSHDFIIKVTNLVTTLQISGDKRFKVKLKRFKNDFMKLLKHQPLLDFKKGYIALNPNSSTSQLYKRIPPVV